MPTGIASDEYRCRVCQSVFTLMVGGADATLPDRTACPMQDGRIPHLNCNGFAYRRHRERDQHDCAWRRRSRAHRDEVRALHQSNSALKHRSAAQARTITALHARIVKLEDERRDAKGQPDRDEVARRWKSGKRTWRKGKVMHEPTKAGMKRQFVGSMLFPHVPEGVVEWVREQTDLHDAPIESRWTHFTSDSPLAVDVTVRLTVRPAHSTTSANATFTPKP